MAITGGLVTAAVGVYSTNRAAKSSSRLARLGNAQAARQAYYDDRLRRLSEDPSSILEDPGYKQAFSQGVTAVERAGTLKGFTGSGNAAIELQRFGQAFASDYLSREKQLLASLAGAQFNPAQAMGSGVAAEGQAFDQLGSTLASLGYLFGGSAFGGGSSRPTAGGPFGSSTGIPGTMSGGEGYIYNIPGGTPPYVPAGGP